MEQQLKKGICSIVCDGKNKGTGFLINGKYIITASHVLGEAERIQAVFMEIEKEAIVCTCGRLEIQPEIDIRVLVIDDENIILKYSLEYSTERIPVQVEFESAGYPGESGGQMSILSGKILSAHDGVNLSDFNIDLDVQNGVLSNYSGLSGAPILVNSIVFGVATFQNTNKLKVIELNKIEDYLNKIFPVTKKGLCILNIKNLADELGLKKYIKDNRLKGQVKRYVHSENSDGIIFIEGTVGSGKTTWINQLTMQEDIVVLGKYFIKASGDQMPLTYWKSEETFYDWVNELGIAFGKERTQVVQPDNYSMRLKNIISIWKNIELSMRSQGIIGIICIDGIDEFFMDSKETLERFCSYISSWKSHNLFFLISTSNYNKLPEALRSRGNKDVNMLETTSFPDYKVRDYFLNQLEIDEKEKYLDVLVNKTKGHPLYMHYLVETINHWNTHEEINDFINNLPDYSGTIETYYEFIWARLCENASNIKFVAYLSRIRSVIDKKDFLEIIPASERIDMSLAIKQLNNLLVDEDYLSFFHGSFLNYVLNKTAYLNEEVHHSIGEYCIQHKESAFSIIHILYHLRLGSSQDRQNSIIYCSQQWVDQCTIQNISPDLMLMDMSEILGLCCQTGNFEEVMRILLLMQRAEYRYNEVFVAFAFEIALAEIELGRPDKAMNYLIRHDCLLVNYENLWICFERMVEYGYDAQAIDICNEVEKRFFKMVESSEGVSFEIIFLLERIYQGMMHIDFQTSTKKLHVLFKMLFMAENPGNAKESVLAASADYGLWWNNSTATSERLKEHGLAVTEEVFNNWILTLAGAKVIEQQLESRQVDSYDTIVAEIENAWGTYEWKSDKWTILDSFFVEESKDVNRIAEALSKIDIHKDHAAVRKINGVDVDYARVEDIFALYRNMGYMGEKDLDDIPITHTYMINQWEKALLNLVRYIGVLYGRGLRYKAFGQVERLDKDVEAAKKILIEALFTFDERSKFKYSYHVPEQILEHIFHHISKYFIWIVPGCCEWYQEYIIEKSKNQFGIYYEGYFRLFFDIVSVMMQFGVDELIIMDLLLLLKKEVCLKVTNRFERTHCLLKIVYYFGRIECKEKALETYKCMLETSMGPEWYKEDQLSLMQNALSKLEPESITIEQVKKIMALFDTASGGMTFERYIRTSKEQLISTLWEKGKYSMAMQCLQKQIFPSFKETQANLQAEPVDMVSSGLGSYRIANCVFMESVIAKILTDNTSNPVLKWALSEIFILPERRYFDSFAKIQLDIIKEDKDRKAKYIERIINILVCDAGEYYRQDLLDEYQRVMSAEDFEMIRCMVKEILGSDDIELEIDAILQQVEIAEEREKRVLQNNIEDDKSELFLPGVWGHNKDLDNAKKLWETVLREERKGNRDFAIESCLQILQMLESGEWNIWAHNSTDVSNLCLEKIFALTESAADAVKVLEKQIVAPKHSRRWVVSDRLIDLADECIKEPNKIELMNVILKHYETFIQINPLLESKYENLHDESIKEEDALFKLLLSLIWYPVPYISQKANELFIWLVKEDEDYIDKVIEQCFSYDINIAEACSTMCLRLSMEQNSCLKGKFEQIRFEEKVESCPYFIVKGNLFLAFKNYNKISKKIKTDVFKIRNISQDNGLQGPLKYDVTSVKKEIEKLVIYCRLEKEWEAIKLFLSEADWSKIYYVLLKSNEIQSIQDLIEYDQRIGSGFHIESGYRGTAEKALYQAINYVQFDVPNLQHIEAICNNLRRLNCYFPLPKAKNTSYLEFFEKIKSIFLDVNLNIIDTVFGNEEMLVSYEALVTSKNNLEILSVNTFAVPKKMRSDEAAKKILNEQKNFCNEYYSDRATWKSDDVNCLTIPSDYNGNSGYKMFNYKCNESALLELKLNSEDVESGFCIGHRKWKEYQSGLPGICIAYNKINVNMMSFPKSMKLMLCIEYSGEINTSCIIDFATKKVMKFEEEDFK